MSMTRVHGRDPRHLGMPVERLTPEDDERWHERLREPVLGFVARGDDPRKNLPLALQTIGMIRLTSESICEAD